MVVPHAMLAAFVSPLVLYAGLLGAGIPIVIHLLSRRRFRRRPWAAIELLRQAERQNRRRVRIEQLILLAMRCLVMGLIGLLLARWFVQPQALAAVLGGSARGHRIVVLDDSYSMAARSNGATVFDAGRNVVGQLARWLQQEAPQDALTLVLASQPDTPVLTAATLRETDIDRLETMLGAKQPSQRGACMAAALEAVRDRIAQAEDAAITTLYVVSDFQAYEWTPSGTDAASGSPLGVLAALGSNASSLRVVLVDVGQDDVMNRRVVSLDAEPRQVPAGVPVRLDARVTESEASADDELAMRVFLDDAAQPSVPVASARLPRGVSVPFEVTFASPGVATVSVELPDDRLPVDNRRYLALNVQRAVRVLVVDGEPATDRFSDEVALLTAAIRPEGPVFSGNEVDVIDEHTLDDIALDDYHVVILANVYRVTEAVAEQLERFAAAGGGVIFFLGDQVDPSVYNRVLYRDGAGVLPARLGEVQLEPGGPAGVAFRDADMTHPLFVRFAESDVPFLEGVRTRAFIAATTDAAATQPQPTTDRAADRPRVLLRYDDEEQHPALIERSFGDGRVLLMTTSADKEWTNLPDWFTYVVLLQEMIQYTARPDRSSPSVLVGEPIVLELEPGRYQPQAVLRTPSWPDEPDVTLEGRPGPSGGMRFLWSDTSRAGVYTFTLARMDGAAEVRRAVVNVDPQEGQLARASPDALVDADKGLDVEYLPGSAVTAEPTNVARQELWPAVWVALLALLVGEHVLAWRFGSRTG